MAGLFENKVVLITGGGSGIGRAAALAFVREGAAVAVADIDADGGQETVRLVMEAGGEAIFIQTDVSQSAEVAALIGQVVENYGRLDCAINNAGIEGPLMKTADISEDDFDRIIAVNLKGVWLCLKHEIPQLLKQGGGVIVNTASVSGLIGTPHISVYGASKHGIVGLTKTAALEYATQNIRINAVCPAFIRTPMTERAMSQVPQLEQGVIASNPSRRLGKDHEVSEAILWLCSPAASFINGVALPIDGGLTAQ